jgi:hypothetical protein
MASPSAEIDLDVTISDTTSSNFPENEIPPAVLDIKGEIVCFMCISVNVAPFRIVPLLQRDHVEIIKYDPNHGEQEVQVPSSRRILLVMKHRIGEPLFTLELMGILIYRLSISFNQYCWL